MKFQDAETIPDGEYEVVGTVALNGGGNVVILRNSDGLSVLANESEVTEHGQEIDAPPPNPEDAQTAPTRRAPTRRGRK